MWLTFIACFVSALIVLEVYSYQHRRATLSQKVRQWSTRWPLITFSLGMIVGGLAWHWWGCAHFSCN